MYLYYYLPSLINLCTLLKMFIVSIGGKRVILLPYTHFSFVQWHQLIYNADWGWVISHSLHLIIYWLVNISKLSLKNIKQSCNKHPFSVGSPLSPLRHRPPDEGITHQSFSWDSDRFMTRPAERKISGDTGGRGKKETSEWLLHTQIGQWAERRRLIDPITCTL